MWQHEIISEMMSIRHLYKKDADKIEGLCDAIRKSEAFYFGLRSSMENVKRTPELYLKNNDFAFPYDNCLFENIEDLDGFKTKKANLILKADDMWIFAFFTEAFTDNTKTKTKWFMPVPIVLIKTVKDNIIYENGSVKLINEQWLQLYNDTYDQNCDVYTTCGHGDVIELADGEASNTLLMLSLLNCKNVVTKTIIPPEKLNKKRILNNKEKLQKYTVLEIVKGIPKEKNAGTEPWGYVSPPQTAFHMCRGHFKTYTEDAPLFGKYTGTFWWQPQARGSKENGEIVKDYVVKTEGAQA